MKKIACLVLLVLALSLGVPSVGAQVGNLSSVTLTAIPPRLGDDGDIKIKPGEKLQTEVRVTNNSDQPLDVESFVTDFIIGDDGLTPIPVKEDVSNRWSLASWVTLTPNNQRLAPKKTGVINVLIEVPADAMPGGHYAIITHQPMIGGQKTDANSISGITQRVGSILYVTVEGPINESAFIHDFKFKPNIAEFGPMHFYYSLENQSDVHLKPQASVEIRNIFKQKVATVQVEPNNVFPGSQRAFTGVWPINWGFGPYDATLTVLYGSEGKVATATTTVWLLPLSVIIAVLILILALITGGIVIKRHLDYRADLARREQQLRAAEKQDDETDQEKTDETVS